MPVTFQQNRSYSRLDLSTLFDRQMETVYFDVPAKYTRDYMTTGPYCFWTTTPSGKSVREEAVAQLNAGTGLFDIIEKSWPLAHAYACTSEYGLRDRLSQFFNGNSNTVATGKTFEEARSLLRAYAAERQQKGMTLHRTSSWIDGFYQSALTPNA